ncbi:V-type ATP synthase subunit I [Chloroflexota bacterium]
MIPLVLNNPESMVKVRVITVKDYSEKTLKTLHKIGVLHIEESKELKPIDKAAIELEQKEVSELLAFVNNVLSYIPQKEQIPLGEDVEVIYTKPFGEIGNEVRLLYNKINKLYEKTVELNDQAQKLIDLKKYLEPLTGQTDLKLKDLNFSGDYLFSRVFILPSAAYENLRNKLKNYLFENVAATVENEVVFHVVAKVRDQKTIESLVSDTGGKILQIPDEDLTLRNFIEAIGSEIHSLEEKLAKLGEELQNKAREDLNRLALLREALSAENERLLVLGKACEAKYVTLIEGWIPENNTESVVSEVKENIDYVFIDTRKPEQVEEPPTKLKNLGSIKPFQVIVNLFATPKYREWDPTPIVAYSFALFFGLMVCDVVYALGIMLIGKFLLSKFVDDPQLDNFKLFQRVIYTCSGVALVCGLLTGQYLGDIYKLFGFENLALVPMIQEKLQNPVAFILLALFIGLIHVNIGHMIAFLRGIKERNKGLVLNKLGLFTLQLGIPSILSSLLGLSLIGILNFLLDLNIPDFFTPQIYSILLYFMVAGLLLVIISSIMQNGGLGAILWLFDATGLLGDVMSYARLAGVGLATFYLASTFNMLSGLFGEMIPGAAGAIIGGIMGIVIILVGHIINLVLTTITGFIHSLRLCFVEFLFKFYEGGGREYSPFKLKKRISVPISI